MHVSNCFCYILLCTALLAPTYSHYRRRKKYKQQLGLALDDVTTPMSHFSFVMAAPPPPQQSLVSLNSISTSPSLGKEYDGNHDQYTTSSTPYTTYTYPKEQSTTSSSGYVGGLGPFTHDTLTKYYANNGLYTNDLQPGYWGSGAAASDYRPIGGNNMRPLMESKYSYDGYDNDYSMSYGSSYDYGSDSIVGSIGSYFSYLFMDPGSILMAAAALSLKALVLNLVLVATNRTGKRRRRRRAEEDSFDFENEASVNSLDSIIETIQLTLEAPENCRARMFCEAGSRIRNGVISKSEKVSSIARYFGEKMEERAYVTISSTPPFSDNLSGPARGCVQHFPDCPDQMLKLNRKLAELSRYIPYIELIPVKDKRHQKPFPTPEEPT